MEKHKISEFIKSYSILDDVSSPEIRFNYCENDFEFDWIIDKHKMLNIFLTSNDRIGYAWLYNDEHGHGLIDFNGKFPKELYEILIRMDK